MEPEIIDDRVNVELTKMENICVVGCVHTVDCDVCPANCQNNMCDLKNGICLSCKSGFMGPFCTRSLYIFFDLSHITLYFN